MINVIGLDLQEGGPVNVRGPWGSEGSPAVKYIWGCPGLIGGIWDRRKMSLQGNS